MTAPAKILVIRRDNIGDLVCTTPLIGALRARFPGARLCALVNSYNRAVLDHHPDIDELFVYTKAKHRAPGAFALAVHARNLGLLWRLRRERFDHAILAGSQFVPHALRLARHVNPAHILGYLPPGGARARRIDIGVDPATSRPLHEVEGVFRLLAPLGIEGPPPPMSVYPDPAEVDAARRKLGADTASGPLIGVHISTRKSANRWPVEKFSDLIRRLHAAHPAARFLLLWAPGDSSNRRHPGDDDNAARLKQALPGLPVIAYPMGPLEQLIADLSLCDTVITSDGGALHIAAALRKPILCFFGDTDPVRWRPWGVPQVLLRPASRQARDITVDQAFHGYQSLHGVVNSRPSQPEAGQGRG